ncbi:hypothetical protein [Herbihabitans rhizosphaerae]|uniref:hypothetical protein n=1 Tax=Herbihabitans rhizosphaerae TaxID=1872711 RepID=UPI00102BCE8A|nr:hypothetical protein [Herbihabitans rhizosphaerae]
MRSTPSSRTQVPANTPIASRSTSAAEDPTAKWPPTSVRPASAPTTIAHRRASVATRIAATTRNTAPGGMAGIATPAIA